MYNQSSLYKKIIILLINKMVRYCKHIFIRGKKAGNKCNKEIRNDNIKDYCGIHSRVHGEQLNKKTLEDFQIEMNEMLKKMYPNIDIDILMEQFDKFKKTLRTSIFKKDYDKIKLLEYQNILTILNVAESMIKQNHSEYGIYSTILYICGVDDNFYKNREGEYQNINDTHIINNLKTFTNNIYNIVAKKANRQTVKITFE